MLEQLGITERCEVVYTALLSATGWSVPDLAEHLHRSQRAVRRDVAELEQLGLVSRLPGKPVRLLAVRPDTAVDLLVAQRRDELDRAQAGARALAAELEHGTSRPDQLIEIIVGADPVGAHFTQLVRGCGNELLVLDRPPYASGMDESEAGVTSLLRASVRVRGIYAPESLEMPGALAAAQRAVRAGERSRVHPQVPMKLAIADREHALLPLVLDDMTASALLIRRSALLDALVVLFELLWTQSTPLLAPGEAADEYNPEQDLLALLAAGVKDEAIARQLGLSPRTVTRRAGALIEALGARTRFQAGALAQRRGWLPEQEG